MENTKERKNQAKPFGAWDLVLGSWLLALGSWFFIYGK